MKRPDDGVTRELHIYDFALDFFTFRTSAQFHFDPVAGHRAHRHARRNKNIRQSVILVGDAEAEAASAVGEGTFDGHVKGGFVFEIVTTSSGVFRLAVAGHDLAEVLFFGFDFVGQWLLLEKFYSPIVCRIRDFIRCINSVNPSNLHRLCYFYLA